MRIFLSVILLFISTWVDGQTKIQPLTSANLPKNIQFKGKLLQSVRFQDNTGSYIALTSQTGIQDQQGDDEFKQAHLYCYVYQIKDGRPVLLWQLHDMITDCNLDMVVNFIPGSLTITDLDKNGKSEVWVAYRLSCRGDVSPGDLKIVMHQGTTQYAKIGIGKIKVGNAIQDDGGVITNDDFKKAPVSFKVYAGKLWDKYALETI